MGCFRGAPLALAYQYFHQMDYFPGEGLLVLDWVLTVVWRLELQWRLLVVLVVLTGQLWLQEGSPLRQLLRVPLMNLGLRLRLF
jgi:hypothetical protein